MTGKGRKPVRAVFQDLRSGGKAGPFSTLCRPDIKALFTSGYSTDRIHESFVLLPGIGFLPKPYGPASLARRVRGVPDKV